MFNVEKVRFKNFRSYGNQFTEVDLTRNRTTVITAKNGGGKTSILHAITFALFGKVTGINKNTLVNDINGKDCVVEIECEKSGQHIFIRRGIKPAIFDIIIDGVMVDQSASSRDYQKWLEEVVLGFNISSFQQVVSISGANYTPFFLLTTGARRKMVEDLLSITVFSKMSALHLGIVNSNKERFNNIEKDIERYEETIKSLKRGLEEIASRDSDIRSLSESVIKENEEKIAILLDRISAYESELDNLSFSAIDLKKLDMKSQKMRDMKRDFESNIKNAQKFVAFMQENTVCPTCHSSLTDDFRNEHICKRGEKVTEIQKAITDISELMKKNDSQISELNKIKTVITNIQNDKKQLQYEVDMLTRSIKAERAKLESVSESSESIMRQEIIEKNALLKAAKKERMDLLIERQYFDLQTSILKDSGIKSRIINQIVPRMTKDINHYLNLMELGANFEIDENFCETIYRRYKDPVTYGNLSAGERARVDIAVLFTWREIAKTKNSLSCNLLFLDEIFDNTLDDSGLELFISLLKNNLPSTNVFLISHRPEVVDKFESNMRIEKKSNFSQII